MDPGAFAEHARRQEVHRQGIDAPMCQDTRSGGLNDLLASAEIGHDALVDLSRKEAFEAPDDLAFGSAIGGASGDVVAGGLVESHADDDGPHLDSTGSDLTNGMNISQNPFRVLTTS